MRGVLVICVLLASPLARAYPVVPPPPSPGQMQTQTERTLWLPANAVELSLSAFLPSEGPGDPDPAPLGKQLDMIPGARLSLGPAEVFFLLELTAASAAERDPLQAVAGGIAGHLGPGFAELRVRSYSRFGRDAQDAYAVQATYALKQVASSAPFALVERVGLVDDAPVTHEPSDHWQWLLAGAELTVQLSPAIALAGSFDASLPVLSSIRDEHRHSVFTAAIGPSVVAGQVELSAAFMVRAHPYAPALEATPFDYSVPDGETGAGTSLAVLVTARYRLAR